VRIDIVTLFPAMVEPVLGESMIGRARRRGVVDIRVANLRDYAGGKHRVTASASTRAGSSPPVST
jgi:tRNA (guanine37-N1)-methyltransferase